MLHAAAVVVGAWAVLAAAQSGAAETLAEGVSFGLPAPTKAGEQTLGGRKAVRYEHDSLATWGCEKPQRDYFHVLLPVKPARGLPLHVVLHWAGDTGDGALSGGAKNPAWIHYRAAADQYALYLDCSRNHPQDWWWGWQKIGKAPDAYRRELGPTEKRVLSTVEWAIREFGIDRNRVYLSGISMGGSGALGIGMCRGDVFAAVAVAVPAGVEHFTHRMAGGDYPDPPVLVNCSSHTDNWAKGQEKLLAFCKANRLPVVFAWGLFPHGPDVSRANPAVFELPWTSIRKDQAYPVFTNASTDDRYPGYKNATAPDQKGQINGYFRWKAGADTPSAFEIELRLVKKEELATPVETPRQAVVDVTPRRVQKFRVVQGATYAWRAMRDGKVIQSGQARPDSAGLLTLPAVKIAETPTRIRIQRQETHEPGEVGTTVRSTRWTWSG